MSAFAAAIAGVAVLVTPAAAEANVVIGQGIAGIKLGDTPATVRKAIGKPTSTHRSGSNIYWGYTRGPLTTVGFSAKQNRVIGMFTGALPVGVDRSGRQFL